MFRVFLFWSISLFTFAKAAEVDCNVSSTAQLFFDDFKRVSNWKRYDKPDEYNSIDEFPAHYINQFYYQPNEPQLDKKVISNLDESLARDAGVNLAIRMRYLGFDKNENRVLVSEYVIPEFFYEVAEGIIAGSNRGEFGGELFFISPDKKVIKLADMNVQDIFKFEGSYVVVSGLDHLGYEYGKLHLLNFSKGMPVLDLLFNLTASPKKLQRIDSENLLLKFRQNTYLFNIKGTLARIKCS